MGEVLKLPTLPWLWLQPHLCESEPLNPSLQSVGTFSNIGQVINFKKFISRYQIKLSASMMQKWDDLLVHEVMRKLYEMNKEQGHSVDDIFARITTGESIPKQDFVRVLAGIILCLTVLI